ncbi:hypothetical protein KAR52_00760 [Candidatus Pacearchaeota archaeon]|nr:hypothetical protein [Candidatus Pacearchaeota archaeon]
MKKKIKKSEKDKKTPKKVKRRIYEIFKIEKKAKEISKKDEEKPEEKIVKIHGTEEQKIETPNQAKSHNKLLKNFLITMGIFTLIIIFVIVSIYSANNFEYKGMKFDVIREGNVIFYHTSFPIVLDERPMNYNVFLRNDPRKLNKIPFEGDLNLLEMMVINNSESFVCDGDGGIAILNFQQILKILGIDTMKDPDAGCDPQGRYMFIQIQSGDVTGIEQTGPACYNFNVNDCEILKVTEKFLIESLAKLL